MVETRPCSPNDCTGDGSRPRSSASRSTRTCRSRPTSTSSAAVRTAPRPSRSAGWDVASSLGPPRAAKPIFAVCAGFQILGETFLDGHGDTHAGLGLIDCRTDRLPGSRAVGELLGASPEAGP